MDLGADAGGRPRADRVELGHDGRVVVDDLTTWSLVAMRAGGVIAAGRPDAVISAEIVRDVFGPECVPDPVSHAPLVVPMGAGHRRSPDGATEAMRAQCTLRHADPRAVLRVDACVPRCPGAHDAVIRGARTHGPSGPSASGGAGRQAALAGARRRIRPPHVILTLTTFLHLRAGRA